MLNIHAIFVTGGNGMKCVDSRKNLPQPCPSNRPVYDCSEVVWYVHGGTTKFEICDGIANLKSFVVYSCIFESIFYLQIMVFHAKSP